MTKPSARWSCVVASFLLGVPDHVLLSMATVSSNRNLNRAQVGFPQKIDNAFLAVDDAAAAAGRRRSAEFPGDHPPTARLFDADPGAPKFYAKERTRLNLSRFYAIAQIEYCRNFHLSSGTFPSTNCSNAAVSWVCSGSRATRLPQSSAPV